MEMGLEKFFPRLQDACICLETATNGIHKDLSTVLEYRFKLPPALQGTMEKIEIFREFEIKMS